MTFLETLLVPVALFGVIGLRLYLGINAAKALDALPPELKAQLRRKSFAMD